MKPIESAELSAYIDNELDAERAREIDSALAADAALKKQFDELLRANAGWKSAADAAAFVPNVTLAPTRSWVDSPTAAVIAVGLLVALRIAPKFSELIAWGLALHAVGLAVALVWISRIARETK